MGTGMKPTYEELEKELREIKTFLRKADTGDAIVCSSNCSHVEIAMAGACNRFLVVDTLGYVLRPKYVYDINKLVDRFLGWSLPDDFSPDGGISFEKTSGIYNHKNEPVGTNLFTAEQAKRMFEYLFYGKLTKS